MRKFCMLMLLGIHLLPMLLLFLIVVVMSTRRDEKVKTIDLDICGCHLVLTMS